MSSGRDLAIHELVKGCREALSRARLFRGIAAKQPVAELRAEYRRLAHFEIDKARGYLRQVHFLRKAGTAEDDKVA